MMYPRIVLENERLPMKLLQRPQPRHFLHQDGMTIIELSLSTVLVVLLSGSIFVLLSGISSGFNTVNAQATNQMNLNQSLQQLASDVRQSVDAPALFSSYTQDALGGGADGAATWILRLPSIDENGNVLNATTLFDHIVYTYDPATRQLSRVIASANATSARNDENPNRVIANDVTAISFSAPSGLPAPAALDQILDITLTRTRTEQRVAYPASLTTRAVYRNTAP